MITKSDGTFIRPTGDITQPKIKPVVKPLLGRWVVYREPLRKHIARNGVKQSMLNYGGVR